jgi:hypothetical protein
LLVEAALADEQDVSEMKCEVHKVIVCKGFDAHVVENF